MYTQDVKPTQSQKKRIQQIFDSNYIIESSIIISNEEKQYKIIKKLEAKIDSLKNIAFIKDEIINKYGDEIILLNKKIRAINNEENNVSDNQLKQAKKPFLGLHLKTKLTLQEFQINRINFSINLSYDFKTISIGLRGWTQSILDPLIVQYKSEIFYGPFIEYKIF